MTEIKPLNLKEDSQSPTEGVEGPEPMKSVQPTPVSTPASASISAQATPAAYAKKKMISWFLILVLLGVGTGFGVAKLKQPKQVKKLGSSVEDGANPGDTFGVMDEEAFSDTAEGEMTAGGIDGEGSHHLVREGDESQYVYLTSSVIDLDQFIGKQVKVWGQTFEAQQAGWLMDVGRLEIK